MIGFGTATPKVAIFRALQLGDLLCSIPAVRALRKKFPLAEITLLGLPWAKAFTERFSNYFDRFIWFPGYPGLPEQEFSETAWKHFEETVASESFDCILQMQGNGSIVNEMLTNLNSRQLAGFHRQDCEMDPRLFIEYPERIHEIERHLKLMEHLGIPDDGTWLEFPVTENETNDLFELLPFLRVEQYVCVHPGSRGSWRQWPPADFAALADCCAENGYRVLVTGTNEEIPLVESVVHLMRHDAINLAGKTSLGMMGALIANASLLISNCTGVSHIASATETPSLVISMDGEPERWGPLNHHLHKTIDWTKQHSHTYVKARLNELLETLGGNITSKVKIQK